MEHLEPRHEVAPLSEPAKAETTAMIQRHQTQPPKTIASCSLLIQRLSRTGGLGLLGSSMVLAQAPISPAAIADVPSAALPQSNTEAQPAQLQPTQPAPIISEPTITTEPEQLPPETSMTQERQSSQISKTPSRSLLAHGLSVIGGVGLISSGVVLAQVPPAPDAGTVPSAQDLLTPNVQVEASSPAPVQAAPVTPQSAISAELERLPGGASTPTAEQSVTPGNPTDATPTVTPELGKTPEALANSDNLYIDTTDYNIGATSSPDQPTVVLSERSTGCQAVLQNGQGVPANLCGGGAEPSVVASRSGRLNSVNIGPISINRNGVGLRSISPQSFRNISARPAALPGNGDRLMFPLSIPTSITSAFGWRMHPIFGTYRFHSGTDIGAPMGTPVLAAHSGKVAIADFMGGYGLTVVLEHEDDSWQTLYAHLSEIYVRPGEVIKQGEAIGRVGSTGNSTGPHLHFEFRQRTAEGWVAMDPGLMLETSLANFFQNFQTAQASSDLVALKDLSKASEAAGMAYPVISKAEKPPASETPQKQAPIVVTPK
jgi:murein DD-endopeptidase MepM/ murein hydrolase activator NlpD